VDPAKAVILALDIGTSEAKGGLITADGRLRATARAGYPIDFDAATGRSEQDSRSWWRALAAISRELSAGDPPIAAICCVGHGPTLVVIDADGEPTRPALTWMDTRTGDEAKALEAATGVSGWGLGILPAARWVEQEDPRAAAATRWYLNTWEWAAFRLTGLAARTRSPGQLLIEPDEAAAAGLAADRLPAVINAGSLVGRITESAARELGLPQGIPVRAGTVDSFASFHGAGLIDPGDAIDTGGTSGGVAVYWDAAVTVPNTWVAPAPLPGRWMVGGAMTSTGKALDWFTRDVLGDDTDAASLIAAAAAVQPGAEGLVFLPYLAGERSPIWDPHARGAFVGLTLGHAAPHLARAIMEAAALALRHVATPIRAAGLRISELRVTGGTASHEAWNQIKADMLDVPVAVPEVREAALLGAALIGATGLGWYTDTIEAIRSMVRITQRCEPNPAHRATYDALFDAYVALWPAIAPTVHRLGLLGLPRG
jgi:xylulokinase